MHMVMVVIADSAGIIWVPSGIKEIGRPDFPLRVV